MAELLGEFRNVDLPFLDLGLHQAQGGRRLLVKVTLSSEVNTTEHAPLYLPEGEDKKRGISEINNREGR